MTFRPDLPPPPPQQVGDAAAAAPLTDGEWHRLHPATPLLKGGIALLVILGFVVNNLRERLIDLFLPGGGDGDREGDPIDYVVQHDYVGYVLLGIVVFILLLVGLFTVSWRMSTFRVTGEVVEVRSGVVFRTHRKARLDRIQGINIVRPFLARLFGAARLEISQAGNDANVQLAYLGSRAADDLRQRILVLASGARTPDDVRRDPRSGRLLQDRVDEFLAPELDPVAAHATRVVAVDPRRLIGSLLLSGTTVFILLALAAIVVSVSVTGQFFLLVTLLPAVIGSGSFYVRRFTKSLRYTIAATRDGIRIGYGVMSTTNETLPPGRIHAVSVTQPLLWRPFGWWDVRINRASHAGGGSQAQQASSLVLPVGDASDVRAVLEIILPELVGTAVVGPRASLSELQEGSAAAVSVVEEGLTTSGDVGGFVRSPSRGAWLLPFSWRRNGYRHVPGAVVFRLGAIWRSLVLVPLPRVQSVRIAQGPIDRTLRLAEVQVHTVAGPITARIGALDAADAMRLFHRVEADAVAAADADTSHRWRARAEPADAEPTGTGREAHPASVPEPARVAPPGWDQTPRPDGDHS